jgi:hypothetical protein
MQEISSSLFSYKDQTFTADISDLEAVHGQVGVLFGIRSAKTGAVIKFKYVGVERDPEGDIQLWEYVSEYLPSVKNGYLRAVVFND